MITTFDISPGHECREHHRNRLLDIALCFSGHGCKVETRT